MVIDTPAVLAILLAEDDASRYARVIEEQPSCRISAANYLEAALVIDSSGGPELSSSR